MITLKRIDNWPRAALVVQPSATTELERAYTAGLVDGEGSIGLTPWRSSHLPIVTVTNTDVRVIEWLEARFSNGNRSTLTRNVLQHRPRLNWRLSGRRAYAFLKELTPYLVLKGEQAELVFEYYDSGGYFHYGNAPLPQAEKDRRAELHRRMKLLNARGPKHMVET